MEMRSRLEQANDNAAAFWSAQAHVHGWEHIRREGYTAVRCTRDSADTHRVVITRPYREAGALETELTALFHAWGTTQLCLEDPYRGLDLTGLGRQHSLEMPVMTREPDALSAPRLSGRPDPASLLGSRNPVGFNAEAIAGVGVGTGVGVGLGHGVGTGTGAGLVVGAVLDADGLAAVERTVVEGFPVPRRQPWTRGELLPEGLLALPGYRAWLARVNGRPAAACVTYDNGETVGVYWVATLPEYRSKGLARAVVEMALAASPGRVVTLVATLLGEPLYRRLGFIEQGLTRWWQ